MSRNAVIVAPWFGVSSGGAEIALLKIGEALRDSGYDVEVYTSQSMAPYRSWLENTPQDGPEDYMGFPIRRFPVDEAGHDRFAAASQALAGGAVGRRFKEEFFRHGMTSSALVEAACRLPEETLILGGPYYQAMVHNLVAALPGRVNVMPAFHDEPPFYFPAVSRLVRDARSLLFLTEAEKQLAIDAHGEAMTRAKFEAPPVSLPFVDAAPARRQEEPGLLGRVFEKYLLYVGRIDEGKNIRQLMNWHNQTCEERLREGLPAIPLFMVGKGVETGFRSPHVKQLGYVDTEAKRQLLSDALGLVNLSLNESFSFVLFEAWQNDVPVIVHGDCKVMRDHIETGKGGYACRTLDEYRKALDSFEEPGLRRVLGQNGRNYAERVCDPDRFLERLSQVLELAQ